MHKSINYLFETTDGLNHTFINLNMGYLHKHIENINFLRNKIDAEVKLLSKMKTFLTEKLSKFDSLDRSTPNDP